MVRLDRALCNNHWITSKPNTLVMHLPRIQSDHRPILIKANGEKQIGPAPFRFLASWTLHSDFSRLVERNWNNELVLADNIENFRKKAQNWNMEVFGMIGKQKRTLQRRLAGVQKALESNPLSSHLLDLEFSLVTEYENICLREELLWVQKSRSQWIQNGDRNTHYYHMKAVIRRRGKKIAMLKTGEGTWEADQETLRSLANSPVTKEETKKALFDMHPLKSPGVDGLHAMFFQTQWNIVGDSVFKEIKTIFEGGDIDHRFNQTLIALIPKVEYPQSIKEFRPISLCTTVYKIVTKILATRLKHIMPVLTLPYQSSFIHGRSITDNIIIAQEVVHSMRTKTGKVGWMAIKVDLEKAFDRLRWDFILDTLQDARLPSSMITLIMKCISSSSMQVLWNGRPSEPFSPQRGIRQGDPLSPYIFVLCMERLSQAIDLEVNHGNWQPIQLGKEGPPLSHLFFADDLILFCSTKPSQVNLVQRLLQDFCVSSGHKYIIDKVQHKLSGWKASSLSLAGRITLAQSVLSSIPLYTMQTTRLPASICDKLQLLTRKFIWGDTASRRSTRLVKWETMCQPKMCGGCGLKDIKKQNEAFLMKLAYTFISQQDLLWVKVMKAKYNWATGLHHKIKTRNVSHLWRCLNATWGDLSLGVKWSLGNGKLIRFWSDHWVGDLGPLKLLAFSPISAEDLDKAIVDYIDNSGNWRSTEFSNKLPSNIVTQVLNSKPPSDDAEPDKCHWNLTNRKEFTVSSAYRLLKEEDWSEESNTWESVWKWPGPQRIRTFLWLALNDKLLTNCERVRRHMASSNSCEICDNGPEDLNHVLRLCNVAQSCWKMLIPRSELHRFSTQPLKDWFITNLRKDERKPSWNILFAILC
ncbi:uncharacterized protein LOC114759480 [Neltuma alba]|uniref:uncharacterized protein LOC114759480 n=1 Tax=Neltuma alba TaxID=207710 RepID=UPI0010A34ABC|nr:uncharacterized protein LOC114759480 [Prosopis alba]